MKNRFFLFAFLLIVISSNAQTAAVDSACKEKLVIELGADFMSRYVWRGVDWGGESPNIQPALNFIFGGKKHSFTLGTWAAYNFNTSNQEIDLVFNYTFNEAFSFIFTDYYFPGTSSYTPSQNKYFEYKQDSTGHLFEGTISFNGTEKIPFTFLFAMNLYGFDAHKINSDSTDGGIARSKYIEIGYNRMIKNIEFNAFIGAALDDPDEKLGEEGYYLNESAGIINLGIKAVKTIRFSGGFEMPVQTSFIINPESQKVFLVFGISI